MSEESDDSVETVGFTIQVPHGQLEALYERPPGQLRGGALLCHPHPQYGGNMHTKALYHLAGSLNDLGFATLRFNFRGVGSSTGEFDQGEGEQADTAAALDDLKTRLPEGRILAGGFSFGAAMGLRVGFEDGDVDGLIGMGLPVDLADFEYLRSEQRPLLLIQGSQDQFGSPDRLRNIVDTNRPNVVLTVVQGAEHLFTGKFDQLHRAVEELFEEPPGASLMEEKT